MEIADDSCNDYVETKHGPVVNSEAINRSRLRVDARKWAMSKMLPKKYGDKIETKVTGDPDAPVRTIIEVIGGLPEMGAGAHDDNNDPDAAS